MRRYLPFVALAALVLLALVGSIASLGQQLMSVNVVLGGAFYALVALCLAAGIVYPIARTLGKPVFGLYRLRSGSPGATRRFTRILRSNLEQRAAIADEDRTAIARTGELPPDELIARYKAALQPVVDRDIKDAAKTSFVTTAISQAPAFDMISVAAVNLRLVRRIVEDCGFRPSNLALAHIYLRVMETTIIAGGIEEMDLEEVVALIGGNAAVSASSALLASAAQGAANAFLTVRVGVITKALIFAEDGPADPRALRRASYGESLAFLKSCGLLDDLRAAMGALAGAARDAVASKATEVRDNAIEQISELGNAAANRMRGLRDSVAERVESLRGDRRSLR